MSHKSRLCQIVVDVPEAEFEATTNFWAEALNTPVEPPHGDMDEYRVLGWVTPGIHMETQSVDALARFHIDIETDDIEAEVARLIGIGASDVERHRDWVVMRDPAGLPFCVVPNFSPQFADQATVWP